MDLNDLSHAQRAAAAVLEQLGEDDWQHPSPCEDWDVADVTRHLLGGERAFAASLAGTSYDARTLGDEVVALPTSDLATSYAEAAAALREALERADPTAAYPTGLGPMPAPVVAQMRTVEALVHGWDIATGAGRTIEVDDAVAERAHAQSVALLERLPPGRTPFAPSQEAPDGASAIDRLAALLGRSVRR